MKSSMPELSRHVNTLSEELSDALKNLQRCIKKAQETIEMGFCNEHKRFKEDLFSCGGYICEDCFVRSQQVGNQDRYN